MVINIKLSGKIKTEIYECSFISFDYGKLMLFDKEHEDTAIAVFKRSEIDWYTVSDMEK